MSKYLVQTIQDDDRLELAFIWNRTLEALDDFKNKELILEGLNDFPQRQADLIVEVAHPKITHEWGPKFLQNADYMDNLEKNHRAILRYPDPEIGSNMGRYWNKDIPGISRDHPDHKFPSRKSCDNPVLRILRSWSQEIILMSGFTDLLALSWPWDNPAEDCTAIDGLTTEAAMTSQPPVQTTEKNNETTSEAPTAPTTKPPTNESTSEAPVVTTQPTTKPPTNESTSEAPVTTPAKPTTPAQPVYPTPAPGAPAVNTYKAANVNGTCLMFKAGIEFTLPVLVNKVNVTKTLGINKEDKSNETEYTGDCDASNMTQTMTVTFYKTSTMLMTFTKSDTGYYFSDVDITFNLNKELFPDIDKEETLMVRKTFLKDQFAADKDGSYKCNDKSELAIQGVNFRTYNLQYAAFQKNITEFKSSGISECSADSDTNSVVPIAVGAALAGLVVIVLIAYLIGRKRSRQSGYEQV
ncbi:CD107 [Mytilus edulis]|uniref:Lysosome-associated membrane glycoprotein 5 n=1 Tax=Mytilus edulis TaxID=6550 RepID=A0A8S3PWN0_MYTED|nr:CD107 [Mytilus edulis]